MAANLRQIRWGQIYRHPAFGKLHVCVLQRGFYALPRFADGRVRQSDDYRNRKAGGDIGFDFHLFCGKSDYRGRIDFLQHKLKSKLIIPMNIAMSAKFNVLIPTLIKSVTVPPISRSNKFDTAPPKMSETPISSLTEKKRVPHKINTPRMRNSKMKLKNPKFVPKGKPGFSTTFRVKKFCRVSANFVIWSTKTTPRIIRLFIFMLNAVLGFGHSLQSRDRYFFPANNTDSIRSLCNPR